MSATTNNVRRVTLGTLTPAELFERLSQESANSRMLAEIICAMYWGGQTSFNLQQLELLSSADWALAIEIMGYRRSTHWSEPQFHVVAQWCRNRHGFEQWADDD